MALFFLVELMESVEFEMSLLVAMIALFLIHHSYKRERQIAALAASYERRNVRALSPQGSVTSFGDGRVSSNNCKVSSKDSASSFSIGSTRTGNESGQMAANQNSPPQVRQQFASYREKQDLIIASFEKSYADAIQMMREWAEVNKALSPTNISTFMHRCSKARKECPADLLRYITVQVETTQLPFAPRAIASALYGLRSCADSDEVQDFLRVITKHLEKAEGTIEAHEVGQCLYGLHRVGPTPNAKALMLCIVDKMHNGQFSKLDGQAVGNAIYGLRKCGGCDEFKQVLEAFTMHLRKQPSMAMIGQNYANALYGLNKAPDSPELRNFVQEMAYRVVASKIPLGQQEIGQACSGLVGLHDCEPVRVLLAALAARIEQKNLILDAQSIGNTLSGLARCGGSAEAAVLVSAIAARICARQDKYGSQMVANAMMGLMPVHDSAEKRLIISELGNRMTDGMPTGAHIAQCLNSLQNMVDCHEVRGFLKQYASKIDKSHCAMSVDEIARALCGLKLCGKSAEAREMLRVLEVKVQRGKEWTEPASIEMAMEGLVACGANYETIQILTAIFEKMPIERADGFPTDLRSDVQELLAEMEAACPNATPQTDRLDALAEKAVAVPVTAAPIEPKSVHFAAAMSNFNDDEFVTANSRTPWRSPEKLSMASPSSKSSTVYGSRGKSVSSDSGSEFQPEPSACTKQPLFESPKSPSALLEDPKRSPPLLETPTYIAGSSSRRPRARRPSHSNKRW